MYFWNQHVKINQIIACSAQFNAYLRNWTQIYTNISPTISSNSTLFDEAKGEYERALENSGYTVTLSYTENQDIRNSNRKKNRKRKIIWYNPPYNEALKTNFGRIFLNLIRKHFPSGHKLHPIINKNNVKLSYSTTNNIKRTLQNHNSKILNTRDNEIKEKKNCSCPGTRKDKSPIDN